VLTDGSKQTFGDLALFDSRLVAETHVESFAKLVDLGGAKGSVFFIAEVVAGVGFAQFQRIMKADGSAAVHLRLPRPFFSGQSRATVTLFLALWNQDARPSAFPLKVCGGVAGISPRWGG